MIRKVGIALGPVGFVLMILSVMLNMTPYNVSTGFHITPIQAKLVSNNVLCAIVPKGIEIKYAYITSNSFTKIEVVKPSMMEFPLHQLSFIKLKICKSGECKIVTGSLTYVNGSYTLIITHNAPFVNKLEICVRIIGGSV